MSCADHHHADVAEGLDGGPGEARPATLSEDEEAAAEADCRAEAEEASRASRSFTVAERALQAQHTEAEETSRVNRVVVFFSYSKPPEMLLHRLLSKKYYNIIADATRLL